MNSGEDQSRSPIETGYSRRAGAKDWRGPGSNAPPCCGGYGDVDIAWSATTDVESRVSHVVLQLPEAVVGTGRVLHLSALAPLTVGKSWRLPGLQPEAMAWQEGTQHF